MYVQYDDIAWWWYYYIIKNITFQRSNKAQWRLGAQQRIYATKNPLHKEINQPMMRQLGDAQTRTHNVRNSLRKMFNISPTIPLAEDFPKDAS